MTSVFQWVYALPQQRPAAAGAETGGGRPVSDRIAQAFDAASDSTGTPFDYLLKTAERESSLDPAAKARTSSAAGLFQFIESTWLQTLKESGPELGLKWVADKISVDRNGTYSVEDATEREAILGMRFDPEISSMMAGALTRKNAAFLTDSLGRSPSSGELYIAHFLGAKGAADFIALAENNPQAIASDHFPRQARANKPIFFQGGRALTAAEVYAGLIGKHGGDAPVMLADGGADLSRTGPLLGYGATDPASRVNEGWRAADPDDAFSGLFRTDQAPPMPNPSASFFSGYAVAPALFQVAVEEDARALLKQAEPLPDTIDPVPSLVERVGGWRRREEPRGPLDLSGFLKTGE